MKFKLLFLVGIFALASCSQKQFSFRKTIKVNHQEQAKSTKEVIEEHTQIVYHHNESSLSEAKSLSSAPTNVLVTPIDNTVEASLNSANSYVANPNNIADQTKEKSIVERASPSKFTKDKKAHGGEGSTAALLGFIFSLVGFIGTFIGLGFIALALLIAGLVLSIVGLKSDRKGLALTGLIFSIIGLVVWLLLIVLIASFISAM